MADGKVGGYTSAGRIIDYLFGRNALIGIASFMLLIISGYATWHGMRDFIIGVSSTSSSGAALPGGLSVSNDALVIAVVVALTFLMWLALRETFGARRTFVERMITLPLYIFLAIWSIGFGYGFWWSLIAGEEATRTGLSGLQEDARDAGGAIAARLDAVKAQLDNVVTWSDSQMAREERSGGSCGVSSGAGQGPLYNARRSVRDQIASLRDGMNGSWFTPVQADLERLQQSIAGLTGGTIEERQKAFETRAAEIRGRARSIANRSNEFGKSSAAEMRALASTVGIAPAKPGFSCYDPTLAQRLTQAAAQAEQPAELKLREAEFNEGPAGVANAIKRLWANIGSYLYSLPSYIISGKPPADATASGDPISGRDLIALLATIGIDLGLLALAALTPSAAAPMRQWGASTQAELHLPTREIIQQLNGAIDTAINNAPGADREWVRRHFIHHRDRSYLVIPNLYSCDEAHDKNEPARGLAMNQLAGVLTDLDLVRWPQKGGKWFGRKGELEKLQAEERVASQTDLTDVRKERLKELEKSGDSVLDKEKADRIRTAEPLRNHGLFSKAEVALRLAGWSEKARRDVEIFPLVETEGLTPLLMVLNAGGSGGAQGLSAGDSPAALPQPPKQLTYDK